VRAGQWRDHPAGRAAPGRILEAGQTSPQQPRSVVPAKQTARERLLAWASRQPEWAIGFADQVWWSRFALPGMSAWQSQEHPFHLVEQSWQKEDPDPKALACSGVLWQEGSHEMPVRQQMWLRFVTGRPVWALTMQCLDWCWKRLAKEGKRHWLLIWDHACWQVSKMVRTWIREHHQQVKQAGTGVRILPFLLPKQSPWLNPIERKAGSMASALWVNRLACCLPVNSLSGSVRMLDARMNLI